MDLKLIYIFILTILPIIELRVGLPLGISYAIKNNFPIILIFFIVVFLNILLIFFIFFFLDYINKFLLRIKIYRKFFVFYLNKFRKKVDKFETKYNSLGFFALVLFVAIPLPGTGAWTGCLVAWVLGLDRTKSIASIALGVIIAGIIILISSLGIVALI